MTPLRHRLRIAGIVQGVGFRPFVWRLARRHGLTGWVENSAGCVVVDVQGDAAALAAFHADLRAEPPPLAVVDGVDVEELPAAAAPAGFRIRESTDVGGPPVIPPDLATCAACLADVADPANRRHGYAFTNCTDCGPRYTIVRGLPYDRGRTTMDAFAMCAACAAEYASPADRRFHAQPNACPACGPQVWFVNRDAAAAAVHRPAAGCVGAAALAAARDALRTGAILAVKGVGGFHLVCDATNEATVQTLRRRKRRLAKPLAVMVADLVALRGLAHVDEQECRLLEGPARPIVLVRRRAGGDALAPSVAPGSDFLGAMLPDSPLHHLLCAGLPPLVMTSGNLADEPIEHDNAAALRGLAPLVDGFLLHDRGIHVPCDDSVVREVGGATLPVRRARGFAPLPIRLAASGRTVLAVGGDLKAALCVAHGATAVMSQHLGDLAHPESLMALGRTADHLLRLCDAAPDAVACDLHPGSLAGAWAARFAAARGVPLVRVQHHEAHVAALLADQAATAAPLVGVCCDGTGFGGDGTVWGGEFFTLPHGTAGPIRRAAHLDTFALPGGDAAIVQPWRTALALLAAAGVDWSPTLAPVAAAGRATTNLRRLLAARSACPVTSSMGRLFDGVASLAGVCQRVAFEAEAALALESLAAAAPEARDAYAFGVRRPATVDGPLVIDWRPVVVAVAADALAGVAPAAIAARFHRGAAEMIVAVCRRLRDATGIGVVGLTGGVFQNARLVDLVLEALRADGFDALVHGRVPPNDGGLALGQAVLARDRIGLESHAPAPRPVNARPERR